MDENKILVVENDENIRNKVIDWLRPLNITIISSINMKDARILLKMNRTKIKLITMDIMLPRTINDATAIKTLMAEREKAQNNWLFLESEGKSNTDQEWCNARFEVDYFDQKIFSLLDLEGGLHLIEEHMKRNGRKLDTPTLYITARENPKLQEIGESYIENGKSAWLVKPVTEQDVEKALRRLLMQEINL